MDATDFRFTVGKDGSLYAFCMAVPQGGSEIKIHSMGSGSNYLKSSIKSVSLLGSPDKINWRQDQDGLAITCPPQMPFSIATTLKLTCEPSL